METKEILWSDILYKADHRTFPIAFVFELGRSARKSSGLKYCQG